MSGLFGNMFDFNHDGKLDGFERAAEFDFLNNVMVEPDKEEHDELLQARIDPEELEYMSADERFFRMLLPAATDTWLSVSET